MAWLELHKNSEALASAAHAAKMEHDLATAHSLFLEAGRAELKALELLNPKEKSRTFSVTAVSAASLFYKGRDLKQAEMIASHVWLTKAYWILQAISCEIFFK